MGTKDKISIEYGKIPFKPMRGLQVSLLANSINFLLATILAIGTWIGVEAMQAIGILVASLSQGMYIGVMSTLTIGGATLISQWWTFFLTPLPAMLVSFVAYIAGAKNFHITNIGMPELPESDRPSRRELKEQRDLEKKSKK